MVSGATGTLTLATSLVSAPSLSGGSLLQRCLSCNTPVFAIKWEQGGASIIIQARHHGHKHESTVPLNWLFELMGSGAV